MSSSTPQPPKGRLRTMQRGVRAMLNVLPGERQRDKTPPEIVDLLTTIERKCSNVNVDDIVNAYIYARNAHSGQFRKSGEPYIIHPVSVTQILAELGADQDTLIAALLHDVVEDTDKSIEDIANDFSPEVALLVDGVTKIAKVAAKSKVEREAESLRKLILTMAKDQRVILIKVADRLHNMRTIHHMPPAKQVEKGNETLSLYAPLAHRLGMQQFKWELEDRSFKCVYPNEYKEVVKMVNDRAPNQEAYLDQIIFEVTDNLNKAHVKNKVTGRQKRLWSIYEKMAHRGKNIDEIYDLVGIRIIVNDVRDCYTAMSVIHQMWRPIDGRFKDYISIPKFNMYQSLHITAVGPGGRIVEVQIRTADMHRIAEYGIAAHWQYKENARSHKRDQPWLNDLVDMQADMNEEELIHNVQSDLHPDNIYVFTPLGEIRELPTDSTPVDFAFAVHTDVGYRTVGAKVDGKSVSLNYKLQQGETVEIITDKSLSASPSQDWLKFVGSSRAKSKIRAWFSKERRDEAIGKGREELRRQLAKQGAGWKRLMSSGEFARAMEKHHYEDEDSMFRAIGDGHVSAQSIANTLIELAGGDTNRKPNKVDSDSSDQLGQILLDNRRKPTTTQAVTVAGDSDVLTTMAKCCSAVPEDPIIGFITRGRGISVHHQNCPNALALRSQKERLIEVNWNTEGVQGSFEVAIEVRGLYSPLTMCNVNSVLAEAKVAATNSSHHVTSHNHLELSLIISIGGQEHLQHVMRQLRDIDGIYYVERSKPGAAAVH